VSRLLFIATPIPGHVIPLRLTAAEMVRRGHHVTFVTSPQFGPQVQATGAKFVPTYGAAAFEVMELVAERNHLPPGPEQLNWEWQRLFVDAVPVQHELIQRELDAAGDEPVVLITDSTCFGGWAGPPRRPRTPARGQRHPGRHDPHSHQCGHRSQPAGRRARQLQGGPGAQRGHECAVRGPVRPDPKPPAAGAAGPRCERAAALRRARDVHDGGPDAAAVPGLL